MSVQENTRKVVTLLKKLNNNTNGHNHTTPCIQKHCCDRLCDIYLSRSLATKMQMTSSKNGLSALLQANFPSPAARAHVRKWLSSLPSTKEIANGGSSTCNPRSNSVCSELEHESIDHTTDSTDSTAPLAFYTKYRRVSSNRMQASCTLGGIDFVWESRSIYHAHDWKLVRMALEDPEDEEMYWRPWHATLDEAEEEYISHKSTVASPQDKDSLLSMTLDPIDDGSLIHLTNDDQSKLKNLTVLLNRLATQQGFTEKPVVPAAQTYEDSVGALESLSLQARNLSSEHYGRKIEHDSDLYEDEYWSRYDDGAYE